VASLALEWKKWRTSSPYYVLCVFGALFGSSGYTAPEMHHQQAIIIQTTRAGAWPVWLIWKVKVSAALLRSRRTPKMLVGAGNELASKQLLHAPHTHTHTHHFPFVHLLNIQSKASMQKRSKNNAKRAPKLHHFSHFFSLYAVVGGAAIWLRRTTTAISGGTAKGHAPHCTPKTAESALLHAPFSFGPPGRPRGPSRPATAPPPAPLRGAQAGRRPAQKPQEGGFSRITSYGRRVQLPCSE
jgi:hypothetical protein